MSINFNLPHLYGKKSYSQFGEDLILASLFPANYKGFYVDMGAHHPFRYSNTYLFYKNGWQGINIDANAGTKKMFDMVRKRDINIEAYIGKENNLVNYTIFKDTAFNTGDNYRTQNVLNSHQSTVKNSVNIKSVTVEEILHKYLPKNKKIDLMCIDTEGSELSILKSNNWKKYKPSIIMVEILGHNDIHKLIKSKVHRYLYKQKYVFVKHMSGSSIFKNHVN